MRLSRDVLLIQVSAIRPLEEDVRLGPALRPMGHSTYIADGSVLQTASTLMMCLARPGKIA
jgi:hypothetical protein